MKFQDNIKGQRIALRKMRPESELAEQLLQVMSRNRESVLTWMAFDEDNIIPKDINHASRILHNIDTQIKSGLAIYYGIFRKDKFIGFVMADLYPDRAEPGSFIDKDYAGKGYVKEARVLLDSELFTNSVIKIVSSVDFENTPCLHLMHSLGYKNEGLMPKRHYQKYRKEYRDEYIFSKTKT